MKAGTQFLILIAASFFLAPADAQTQTTIQYPKNTVIHGPSFYRSDADTVFMKGRRCFGVGAPDINNDGYADLFFNNMPGPNDLYLNNGSGGFIRLTNSSVATETGYATGQAWADYDNDGDVDVFIAYQDRTGNVLYRNNGNGSFDKPAFEGLTTETEFSFHPVWAPINGDNLPDLLICNNSYFADENGSRLSLYLQQPGGVFIKDTASFLSGRTLDSSSSNFCDYDEDGDQDLLVSTWGHGVYVFKNDGFGGFTNSGADFSRAVGNFTSCSWVDFDSDGDFDIFLTRGHPGKETCMMFRNEGADNFQYVETSAVYEVKGRFWNSGWGDFDNDGDLDLCMTDLAERNFLFENDARRNMVRVIDNIIVADTLSKYACANLWVDLENDGDLDLVLANLNDGHNPVFLNSGNQNNWLEIRCETPNNSPAIGAIVKITAVIGGREVTQARQVASVEAFRTVNHVLHFGLGDARKVNEAIVIWPTGEREIIRNIRAGQIAVFKKQTL